MKFTFFDRIFYFFSEDRQWQKLFGFLRTYFTPTPMVEVLIVLVLVWLGGLLYAKACKKRQLFYRILRMSVGLYWVLIFCLSVANRQPSVRSLHLVPEAWLADESGFHESNVILSMINFCYYIPYGMLLGGQGKETKVT